MSLTGILFGIALIILSGIYVLAPLFSKKGAEQSLKGEIEKQKQRALNYYERVIINIRDLDEDKSTGKIHQQEYTQDREIWVQRGISVLKIMDELNQQQSLTPAGTASEAEIDAAIEKAIEKALNAAKKA
ncbi:hypothetical protein MASR2M15_18940 [Anaerolineales bacterium]